MARHTSLGFAPEPTAPAGAFGTGPDGTNPADPWGTNPQYPATDPNAWDSFSPAAPADSTDGVDPNDPYGVKDARKPLIDAKKNPLRAIGAILLNTSAGLRGKPLYTDELMRQYQEEEQINLQKMQLSTSALTKGLELIKNTPAAQRADVARAYSKTIGHALGSDFSDIMMKAAQAPDNSKAFIDFLGQNGQDILKLTGGDYQAAMELAKDDKFIARIQGVRDQKLGGQLLDHLNGIDKTLDGNPEYDAIQNVLKNGWTSAEARDPLFQRATGITNDMLDALDRSPALQEQLRSTGYIPPSDQKLMAEEKIKAGNDQVSVFDKGIGQLRFATRDEIAKDPTNLLPADAKPDKPDKPDFEGGLMAVNPKNGEVLDSPVTFDGNKNTYSLADGSPLPAGYIVTRATLQAAKAGDLGGLSKGAQAKTENDLALLNDSLSNMRKVSTDFKPEYLQALPNLKSWGLAQVEKFGADLSAKDKDTVSRFATYKQDSIQVMNEGIKAITGAAMTDTEAERLRKQFADIENDSPTQFKSKVDNAVQKVQLAIARRQWMLEHGATVDFKNGEPTVSLDGYQAMIESRGKALVKEYQSANPSMSLDDARKKATAQVKQEYHL